jgi:hypothetical protein
MIRRMAGIPTEDGPISRPCTLRRNLNYTLARIVFFWKDFADPHEIGQSAKSADLYSRWFWLGPIGRAG